jgi:hypothetical protein
VGSRAYTEHLEVLLKDAEELELAHRRLRTGAAGRQWGLGALNRGVVVLCVSAWEAYVEALVREAVSAIRPSGPTMGVWAALDASARTQIGRFNNPTPDHVRTLFAEAVGVPDVTTRWHWQRVDARRASERLAEALELRHKIAHGVNPRPTVQNPYTKRLPGFFRHLGRCTDRAMRDYLVGALGARDPWST